MPTEKTPLTGPSTSFGSTPPALPFYVQDTHRFYSRRRRERQIQCIMFVTIIATFILALIVTISYSANHPDLLPPVMDVSEAAASGPLQSAGKTKQPKQLKNPQEQAAAVEALSDDEVAEALRAGNEAIDARRLADATARPLPRASAGGRHQLAVGTSARAGEIALAGLAELAATRRIEAARSFMGRSSGFGAFLNGRWTGPELDDLCTLGADLLCPAYAARFRRLDGACNQPQQRGMAYSAYRRALPPDYADGIGAPRVGRAGQALPSAREVSLKVHPPSPSTNPQFTVMLAVFGQFLDHDITATAGSRSANGSAPACCLEATARHPECFPVRVGPGDPVFDLAGSSCMEFVRSAPAAQCRLGPRQQLNQVTAFIDGSAIYGSELAVAEGLREFVGGRLRMQLTPDGRELLPASRDPEDGCNRELELARGRYCFASGDARANENLHLTTMHLLWARQHNLLAGRLAALNPQWDDERLYQETRRLVGAQLQHVAYREFLPIVLGAVEVDRRGLRPPAQGFRAATEPAPDPSIANYFSAAAFRFAHTLLPGLMKVTDRQKATTSYVQLHMMLFNPYSLYGQGGVESSITTATSNTIQQTSTHVSSQLTQHLFEDPLANQSSTVPCGLDLVSLNIQRGRDHGLPGYVKWRGYCGLSVPGSFGDLASVMDPDALAAISKLYDSVDDVDLYTGALAEINRGDGLVGPTFTCLIADQFERLQAGDRYWYEMTAQPGSFAEDQLREIRKTTLARIICDTSDGINKVQPEVMRSIGPDNPMMSCEDIAQVSLQAWRTEIPLLTATDTVVPTFDWLKFKGDVNKTIGDIVASIAAKEPPVRGPPADWLTFQNDINITFTDLLDKFSTLHPRVTTNVSLTRNLTVAPNLFDLMGLKDDVSRTMSEIMDSIIANEPVAGSLPADWLAYRKGIKDSLLYIKKKFKLIHPTPVLAQSLPAARKVVGEVPTIDWAAIKSEINSTTMDIVDSINSTRPFPGSALADWFAFRKRVKDSLVSIKNEFTRLQPRPTIPVPGLAKLLDDPTLNWLQFKDQLNQTPSKMIASTASKEPPSHSTPAEGLDLQEQPNKGLAQFVDQLTGLHPKELDATTDDASEQIKGSSELAIDAVNKSIVNRTIAEIVAEINASKPAPGNPQEDWLAFQQKMNDAFAGMQRKYSGMYEKNKTRTKPKLEASADAVLDMVAFKDDLNKGPSSLIDLVKSKKPAVNSSMADWLAYKRDVKAPVSKLKKDILFLSFQEQVNSTIEDALDEIASNQAPPEDGVKDKKKKKTQKKGATTVMRQLAEMRENLKAIQAEWLERAKAVTDVMVITDVPLTAISSSSALGSTYFTFNFCMMVLVLRTRSTV